MKYASRSVATVSLALIALGLMGFTGPGPGGPASVSNHGPGIGGASERVALPAWRDWQRIEPAGNEDCGLGTPFSFFYRAAPSGAAGESTDSSWTAGGIGPPLLIYFEGGGACWDWVSCSGMFDTNVATDELADFRGIFDFGNPANPFRDHAVLFIPYCTGDVHVGDADVVYGDDPNAPPVRHRGARNVGQALGWAEANLGEPPRIVIAGASAGSYGAIFHAPRIAALFPSADLVTIGDSGVPLLHEYEGILERWGAGPVLRSGWGAAEDSPLTLERAYREAAAIPRMEAVVQVTSDRDHVQSAFYLISGSPAGREASYALLDGIEREGAGIRSFVVAGADHGLMRTDKFYEYEADGTALAEWISRLIAGDAVESVRCPVCMAAPE